MDPKVFTDEEMWQKILAELELEEDELLSRYDAIIRLNIAPK